MEKERYGLKIVSMDDESGIPFGMHEGVIITSSHPVMEATIFRMKKMSNIYCQDEYFSVSNDAILRHSTCSADLLNYLSTLAMQYFDIDYEDLVITDDLVKCLDILDSGLSYERKKMINSLESKRKRKILDFKKKE